MNVPVSVVHPESRPHALAITSVKNITWKVSGKSRARRNLTPLTFTSLTGEMPYRLLQSKTTQKFSLNNSGSVHITTRTNTTNHQLINNFNLPSHIFFLELLKSRKTNWVHFYSHVHTVIVLIDGMRMTKEKLWIQMIQTLVSPLLVLETWVKPLHLQVKLVRLKSRPRHRVTCECWQIT